MYNDILLAIENSDAESLHGSTAGRVRHGAPLPGLIVRASARTRKTQP
jgi:hypothetical protein